MGHVGRRRRRRRRSSVSLMYDKSTFSSAQEVRRILLYRVFVSGMGSDDVSSDTTEPVPAMRGKKRSGLYDPWSKKRRAARNRKKPVPEEDEYQEEKIPSPLTSEDSTDLASATTAKKRSPLSDPWSKKSRTVHNRKKAPPKEEEYEVEKILNHIKSEDGYRYLVQWVGYPDPTWNLESDMTACVSCVREYWSDKSSKPDPEVKPRRVRKKEVVNVINDMSAIGGDVEAGRSDEGEKKGTFVLDLVRKKSSPAGEKSRIKMEGEPMNNGDAGARKRGSAKEARKPSAKKKKRGKKQTGGVETGTGKISNGVAVRVRGKKEKVVVSTVEELFPAGRSSSSGPPSVTTPETAQHGSSSAGEVDTEMDFCGRMENPVPVLCAKTSQTKAVLVDPSSMPPGFPVCEIAAAQKTDDGSFLVVFQGERGIRLVSAGDSRGKYLDAFVRFYEAKLLPDSAEPDNDCV